MSGVPITHELRTYDRQTIGLTAEQAVHVESKLREGKKLIQIGAEAYIGASNIASLQKIRHTQVDMLDPAKTLPAPKQEFDPNGKGYQYFLKQKAKLTKKWGLK